MFWGNDHKINGDRAYSTYVELSVPFRAGGLDWDVRAGITPMESAGYTTTISVPSLSHLLTIFLPTPTTVGDGRAEVGLWVRVCSTSVAGLQAGRKG